MAAKRITLPLGLDISDINNIGTYTFVSGRDYDTNLIKLHNQIRSVLGESISKVRGLCLSPNINKYAAFKPNRGGHPSGMTIIGNGTNFIFDYNKPTDTSGYRMGDFAGYNHEAFMPEVFEGDTIDYIADGATDTTNIIVTLPEYDVRDFGIDRITIVSRKQGGGFTYTNSTLLDDSKISNKNLGVQVQYVRETNNYTLELETWYGSSSNAKYVEHEEFISTIPMNAMAEPTISFLAEFPLRFEDSSSTYNYNNGDWLVTYRIYDDFGGGQQGGLFDIYAKRSSDSSWTYQKQVNVSSTADTTSSGTLTFTKPLQEAVQLEWRPV